MGRFWSEFKKSWNDQMVQYGFKPPADTGTGNGNPDIGWEAQIDLLEWEPIYEKFRERMGRDPYSFRELQDWWNSY